MKRLNKILLLLILCFGLTGCFKRDDLEGIDIYTTVYPVEYIMQRLYGDNSNVLSIYPDKINVKDYKLTKKQIKDYSKAPIFVYNGLSNEKQIARDFLNNNKNLLIIDVSYGLKYNFGQEELWLSPNNYLMLSTNVKNNLQEFIKNKFIKEEIENNYKVLEEELSEMDAELRSIARAAENKNKNTILVNDPIFKYLENYGFNIIDLSDKKTEITNLTANLKNGTYKYILVRDDQEISKEIKNYIKKYKTEIVKVEMMNVLDEKQRKENDNYLNIMKSYMEKIRNIVLG